MRDFYLVAGMVVVFYSLFGICNYFHQVNDQRIVNLEKLIYVFTEKKGLNEIKKLVRICNFTDYIRQISNCLSGGPNELYPVELELVSLKTMVKRNFSDLEIEKQVLKIQQLLRN